MVVVVVEVGGVYEELVVGVTESFAFFKNN